MFHLFLPRYILYVFPLLFYLYLMCSCLYYIIIISCIDLPCLNPSLYLLPLHYFTCKVMGPAVKSTLETLQFLKLNGMNYHMWADNIKAVLQAKSLWEVICGYEHCPPQSPHQFPKLVVVQAAKALSASSAKGGTSSSVSVYTGPSVLEVLQLKDYWNWEFIVDRYKR